MVAHPSSATDAATPRPSLRWLPEGTVLLTVARLVSDSHQRGGRRTHLGRVKPEEVAAFLVAQGPGRYRIACVGPRGRFVRDGAFAVEVGPHAPDVTVVPARTSRDYRAPRPPSTVARGKERRALQRLVALRQRVRDLECGNARLREEAAATAEHARAERLRADRDRQHWQGEVERLAREVGELRGRLAGGEQETRGDVADPPADPVGPRGPSRDGTGEVPPVPFAQPSVRVEAAARAEADVAAPDNGRGEAGPGRDDRASRGGALGRGFKALASVRRVAPGKKRPKRP